jgi:hypothetical protein
MAVVPVVRSEWRVGVRWDMAKVIVERPRLGSRYRREAKGRRRELQRRAPEDWAWREGIGRRGGGSKILNEHLAPLRRFLAGQVGRRWDDVFSEICARVSRNSAVQDHVRDHVWDYVLRHVVLIDGVPCSGEAADYGTPLNQSLWRRRFLYVCPRTGLLRSLPPRPRRRRPPGVPVPRPLEFVRVDDARQCRRIGGAWHLVSLRPLPQLPFYRGAAEDVVLGRPVRELTLSQAIHTYGAAVYAVAVRRLRKPELRQYPIPVDAAR